MTENGMVVAETQIKSLQKELELVRAKNMVVLGDKQAFWIQEAGQQKRAFRAKIALTYPTQFCFPGGDRAMVTGEGYDAANQYANIEVFRPKYLMGQDGTEKGNPYFERDNNGAIVSIFLRGLGVGYGPTGSLVAVDQTIFLNIQTLLIQEIQAKIKKHPFLGCLGRPDEKPTQIVYYEDNGKSGKYRVVKAEPVIKDAKGCWSFIPHLNGLGYWVEISHPYIQEAFDNITQKQRYLERSAFTILKRLILSSHPAIGTKTPIVTNVERDPDNKYKILSAKAHIFVYGFCHQDEDPKQKHRDMQAMAERVAQGEAAANMEVIQSAAIDGSEEELEADRQEFSDPSEIPAEISLGEDEDFEDGPGDVYYPPPSPDPAPDKTKTPAPVEPAATRAPAEKGDVRKRLKAAMKDPAKKDAIMVAKKKLNFATFEAISTASDGDLEKFLKEIGA